MMKIKDLKLKIVEKFKIFASISLAIILVGIVLMIVPGMNVGLDFAGGAKLDINFGAYLETHENIKDGLVQEVNDTIKGEGFEIGSTRWSGEGASTMEIGLKYVLNDKPIKANDAAKQKEFMDHVEALKEKIVTVVNAYDEGFNFTVENIVDTTVSGSTAQKVLSNAIWATVVAIIVMLIYIGFRFTLSSGLAAIIALTHDVLIMLALTTIFRIQVNTTFIAAIITIVGYSINATIVIFDRIREVAKLESSKELTDVEIANKSIGDTLGRTILTTITTLAVIVVLAIVCAIMGVSTMGEFALPIIFGLIAGTYSSVFLSASSWVYLRRLGAKIKIRAKKKAK